MISDFDPEEYYKSYPQKVILRPGYPARAQYKSTLIWKLYGDHLLKSLGKIHTYADIGGCFGFGANAMAFQIFKATGIYPKTKVFEISEDFIEIGRLLFPYIEFIQENLAKSNNLKETFDLITLFDVIEHIPDPQSFLYSMAHHSKYAMLLTPTETSGDWFGAKSPEKKGNEHSDGHINFFTPKNYLELLKKSGWELIEGRYIMSLANNTTKEVLEPEVSEMSGTDKLINNLLLSKFVPNIICRKIFGLGFHIGLAKSCKVDF